MKMPKPCAGLPSCSWIFGKPLRKVVDDVVDRMRERHVDERTIRKDALDLASEARVEPVVVVRVQKAAALEIRRAAARPPHR